MIDLNPDELREIYQALKQSSGNRFLMLKLIEAMPLNYQKTLDPRWTLAADRTWLFNGIPEKELDEYVNHFGGK